MSGRVPVPPSLKKMLGKYLMAAKSFKKISPVTALYCKLWALDLAKSKFGNDTKAYILQLADDCIAEKNSLNPTPEDAKSQIRATGNNIFKNIYLNESSLDSKNAAKGYRDCFVCFEILKHPNLSESMSDGELEIYSQNAKYLTFKAAAAMNPDIVKDEMPEPPPGLQRLLGMENGGGDEADDDALLKELDDMEIDASGDPWASFNSTQPTVPSVPDEKENDTTMPDASNLNSFNPESNPDPNPTGSIPNANPYYGGGGGMGNPYYGGGGMGMGGMGGDPNSTMSSADNPNNGGGYGGDMGISGLGDGDMGDNNDDPMLPSPPGNKPENKPASRKQPSYADLTKELPAAKYDGTTESKNDELLSNNNSSNFTDLSSYTMEASGEATKVWSLVKNGDKYKKECIKTLDEAIYCLMLGEPDFRGAIEITQKALKMINLCRQSVGLKVINIPPRPPTDIPPDTAGDKTNDWFGKPIGTKKFFRLQELSFEAEGRLKKGKRKCEASDLPGTDAFVIMTEAVSMLQPVASIQPAW